MTNNSFDVGEREGAQLFNDGFVLTDLKSTLPTMKTLTPDERLFWEGIISGFIKAEVKARIEKTNKAQADIWKLFSL